MRERFPIRRSPLLSALAALIVAASAFVLVIAPQPTAAAWQSNKVMSVTATALTPAAVPTVVCGASSGLLGANIPIAWTAPAGVAPTRYRIQWTGSAGSGVTYATTSPGSINVSGISVVGTSTVTVYPEYGDWIATPPSLQTVKFSTLAIVVVVSWTCSS